MKEKASLSEALRLEVRRGEAMSEEDYSAQRVRLSIVHTREDMVTVVFNLSEILDVLKSIRLILYIVGFFVISAALHYLWP